MPISEFVLGGIISLVGILVGIVASVLGWLALKYFNLRQDVDSIDQSYWGNEHGDGGHLQETRKEFERIHGELDDLSDLVCSIERRRIEEHEEVKEYLVNLVDFLQESGINGDVPNVGDAD